MGLLLLIGCARPVQAQELPFRIGVSDTAAINRSLDEAVRRAGYGGDSAHTSLRMLEEIRRESVASGYRAGIRWSLMESAAVYIEYLHEPETGQEYLRQAMFFMPADPVRLQRWVIYWLSSMGVSFFYMDKPDSALLYYSRSLSLISALDWYQDTALVLGLYNNITTVLIDRRDFQRALRYVYRAESMGADPLVYPQRINTWIHRAAIALEQGQDDSLMRCLGRISKLEARLAPRIAERMDMLKGAYYRKKGMPDSAAIFFKRALDRTAEPRLRAFHISNLASLYIQQENYQEAARYLERSLTELHESSAVVLDRALYEICRDLAFCYGKTGDYRSAYYYADKMNNLRQKIFSADREAFIGEQETRFRTAEKDRIVAKQSVRLLEQDRKLTRQYAVSFFSLFGILLMVILFIWRYQTLKRRQQHRQELSRLRGIIEGEEKERSRLASELHDGINSQLAAVRAFLAAGQRKHSLLYGDPDINAAIGLLKDTTGSIRHITHHLAPHALQYQGLTSSVRAFCSGIFADTDVHCEVELYGEVDELPPAAGLHLYRIVQELSQNVRKHADADSFTLLFYRDGNHIRLTAEDNGRGMPADPERSIHGGMGLQSIRERVKMMGGAVEVVSGPGKGTLVSIDIPDISRMEEK